MGLIVVAKVGLKLSFDFESAHKLVMNLNVDFQKSMNLNLDFAKSMHFTLIF